MQFYSIVSKSYDHGFDDAYFRRESCFSLYALSPQECKDAYLKGFEDGTKDRPKPRTKR